MKKKLLALIMVSFLHSGLNFALSKEAREKGFVYLDEIDPTIQASLRYCSNENFVGTSIEGYRKSRVILTKQAAEALKRVQETVKQDGYSLVVYDAYRPQQAVDHFMRWSKDSDKSKRAQYYPRIDKARVFELGYIAERSGHSRGSTVDLTIIQLDKTIKPIQEKERILLDGCVIKLLDDGTVDMGSSFDLCDIASHHDCTIIEKLYANRRNFLKTVMEKHGFKSYSKEWWHFTLINEPYPADREDSYFNFPVE